MKAVVTRTCMKSTLYSVIILKLAKKDNKTLTLTSLTYYEFL